MNYTLSEFDIMAYGLVVLGIESQGWVAVCASSLATSAQSGSVDQNVSSSDSFGYNALRSLCFTVSIVNDLAPDQLPHMHFTIHSSINHIRITHKLVRMLKLVMNKINNE